VTRRGWAIGILAAWVLALGWLVKRVYFRSTGARLAEAALSVPPGAIFYRLEVGGQQVGFASSTLDTLTDSIRVTDQLVLDAAALGHVHRTIARSAAIVNRALRLQHVDATFDGDGAVYAAHASLGQDSTLSIGLASGADTQTTRLRLARPIVLPSLLPLRLAFGGELKAGSTFALRLFDPMLLAERDVALRVAAETTLIVADSADYDSTAMAWVAVRFDTLPAFRIDQESGGLSGSLWIDAQGHVVRATTATGFTLQRTAFEIAYENFRHRDTTRLARASATSEPGDIVAATAFEAGTRPASDPHPVATARFRLRLGAEGQPLSGFDVSGGRQQLAGDTLTVRRESASQLQGRYRLPALDTAVQSFLRPDALIESTNPRIQAQARLILQRERDPAAAAALLTHWVFSHVRPATSTGAPSAVQTLESQRGDCNERTVLYVALARSAGLPARTAAGLLSAGGRFYYHAWPEVYLGDWVAVDPTFDQFPADAAHLRLAVGGLARRVELARLIGKLTLEAL
jgi:transglutaminase-like putative cysteine protease